jgi:hypothetical protein
MHRPVSIALATLAVLVTWEAGGGEPARTGSSVTVVRQEGELALIAWASGVRVIRASGQAAHTGVAADDLITVIDGVQVRAPQDLMAVLRAGADKAHHLRLLRSGKALSVWSHPATWRPFLTSAPPTPPATAPPPPAPTGR